MKVKKTLSYRRRLPKKIKLRQLRVAKMEASDPSVSLDLLIRALLATGATRNELARVFGSSSKALA
jgi:hypothetical protein